MNSGDDIEGFGLGSSCPQCGSSDCWFEIGPGEKPGYNSMRLHCKRCGHVHKQDVEGDGQDPLVKPLVPC